MGLDQYAFITREELTKDTERVKPVTQYQWRKHAKLQKYFETLVELEMVKPLYDGRSFNCNPIKLDLDVVTKLLELVRRDDMPASGGGFFYGHQFQDESAREYKEQDIKFCADAIDAIKHGGYVYYDCWY
jgi:hypothetical protein